MAAPSEISVSNKTEMNTHLKEGVIVVTLGVFAIAFDVRCGNVGADEF
ncbi:MAG TPA: hypothetical protein VG269_27780 [Tepidisphaeraceae bacterium]|jgi:hypothetical protein|nr:hypothetical protein [Tepidisphaeraceae bacterium]